MARNSSVVAGVVPSFVGTAPDHRRVVEWVFRIAVAMEFVGHGAFGITTKAAWVPYFGLIGMTLRWAIGLCLIGHGGIALFTHTRWTVYLEALGVSPASAVTALHAVGWFELALGAAVLVAPFDALLVFVCLWKVASEALRISVGEPLWEFIERGGAYAAPLLLILLQRWPRTRLAG